MNNHDKRFPPWSMRQSLNELTEEAGIDFEIFIENIHQGISNAEMAKTFDVSEKTIESLVEHFYRYGVSSVQGGD